MYNKNAIFRIGCCVSVFAFCLYSYFSKQNELIQAKILLPALEKEIASLREETKKLRFEVDLLENPSHLIELAHCPEYGHLKHPLLREILTVSEDIVAQVP